MHGRGLCDDSFHSHLHCLVLVRRARQASSKILRRNRASLPRRRRKCCGFLCPSSQSWTCWWSGASGAHGSDSSNNRAEVNTARMDRGRDRSRPAPHSCPRLPQDGFCEHVWRFAPVCHHRDHLRQGSRSRRSTWCRRPTRLQARQPPNRLLPLRLRLQLPWNDARSRKVHDQTGAISPRHLVRLARQPRPQGPLCIQWLPCLPRQHARGHQQRPVRSVAHRHQRAHRRQQVELRPAPPPCRLPTPRRPLPNTRPHPIPSHGRRSTHRDRPRLRLHCRRRPPLRPRHELHGVHHHPLHHLSVPLLVCLQTPRSANGAGVEALSADCRVARHCWRHRWLLVYSAVGNIRTQR
mmetsp:Transcript_29070/g.68523  ORF Transcript_29070/g.68523 Transcript_29070/m.68523 type:complete len:351 (-) Transcript_29070:202-1254(-)